MNSLTAKFVPEISYLCWLYYYQHRTFGLTDSSAQQYALFRNVGSYWCNSRLHSNMSLLIELV